jgi:hypothetical protein
MVGDNQPALVTRREFHSALAILWVYIFLALGDLARIEGSWTTMALALAASAMATVYAVSTWRAGPSGASNRNLDAAPPERVKEIVRDPHRGGI